MIRIPALLTFLACFYNANAQVEIPFHSTNSAGVTSEIAANSTYKLVASVGQPFGSVSSSGFFAAAGLSFQSSVIDDEPPEITFNSLQFSLVKDQNTNFEVTATDNFVVTSIYLYYKPITQSDFDSVALVSAGGNYYNWLITSDRFQEVYDVMGMEYYIKAFDSKNSSRFPQAGSAFEYLMTNNTQFPLLVFGSTVQKYRMVSIPFDNSNNAVLSIFEEFSSLRGRKDYRIFHYTDEKYVEMPYDLNSIERGKGYFLIVKEALGVNLEQQTAPKNNRDNLFEMVLNPGWNMIGNPYPVSISWDEVKSFNGDPADLGGLKKYAGTWVTENTLLPFEGAFVHLDGTQQFAIKIPFQGQLSTGGRSAKMFSNDINDQNGWSVPIDIHTNELTAQGSFGMKKDASLYADRYDDFNVPRFIEYAEIAFPHSEHNQGFFSQDIVPMNNEFTWRFNVNSSSGPDGVLSWDNTSFRNGGKHLYLYDTELARVVDMRRQNSYTFEIKNSKEFKVYFGDFDILEKISPDEAIVEKPFPNPFTYADPVSFTVRVPWSMTDHLRPTITIQDLLGQKVYDGFLNLTESNTFSLKWNGENADGAVNPSGVYMYTVTAGARIEKGRIILKN